MALLNFIDLWLFASAILGFLGTLIIALSLGGVFSELRNSIGFLHVSIMSIISRGDIVNFEGLIDNIDKSIKKNTVPTVIGLLFVLASFGCGLLSSFKSAKDLHNKSIEITCLTKQIDTLLKRADSVYAKNTDIQLWFVSKQLAIDSLKNQVISINSKCNSASAHPPLRR